jgi:hypothetical protein
MKNPFLFMVGCQRSGTTLLQHMVNSHPQVAVMPEGGWFGTWYELRLGVSPEGFATPGLTTRVLRTHKNIDLGTTEADLEAMVQPEGKVRYSDFVSALFDRCGKARGKALVGSKNPDYLRRLPTLHHLWPQAKFVHIIRDGRDVCLSLSKRWKDKPDFRGFPLFLYEEPDRIFDGWTKDPVATTALWWEWTVGLGRHFGASLPRGMYHEMRYEDLVADPERESRALCDFLGVPFDDAMLHHEETFVARKTKDGSILHASVGKPVTAGLRDWRSQMEASEIDRFEAMAGAFLDELGYERMAAQPSAESVRAAAEIRAAFRSLTASQHASAAEKTAPTYAPSAP